MASSPPQFEQPMLRPGRTTRARLFLRWLASRLSRRTRTLRFLREIDGLRFVAISLVVLYHSAFHVSDHAPSLYVAIASHGDFGVQLFFAISGFVLALPFARHHLRGAARVPALRYIKHRLWRLEPPYVINLVFFFALKVAFRRVDPISLVPHLLASIFYQHALVYGRPSEINFFAWSLEVELQFYMLAPFLFAVIFCIADRGRRRALVASAVFVLSTVRAFAPISPASVWQWTVLAHIEWFVLGALLADVFLIDWHESPRLSRRWDVVGVVAWTLLFITLNAGQAGPSAERLGIILRPWLVLAAYASAFRGKYTYHALTRRPIYLVGGMCYSIYLYHGLVVSNLDPPIAELMAHHNWFAVVAFAGPTLAAAVLILGAITFVLFERPFMQGR